MCTTASSFGADWLKGCHGYRKVPPPSKPLRVAEVVWEKKSVFVCEEERVELPRRHLSQQRGRGLLLLAKVLENLRTDMQDRAIHMLSN